MTTATRAFTMVPDFAAERASAPFAALLQRLASWDERYRQRQRLAGLSEGALIDIGVSRGDAQAEARKPAWID
jgi:uncharacterized protein YjiS (DUF1127 family)